MTTPEDEVPEDEAPVDEAPEGEAPEVPRLGPDEFKAFVRDVLSGEIFVAEQLGSQIESLLGIVFIPIALGADVNFERSSIGTVYARYRDGTIPNRGINGFPMFLTCGFVHREDWILIKKYVRREQERRAAALDDLDKEIHDERNQQP